MSKILLKCDVFDPNEKMFLEQFVQISADRSDSSSHSDELLIDERMSDVDFGNISSSDFRERNNFGTVKIEVSFRFNNCK